MKSEYLNSPENKSFFGHPEGRPSLHFQDIEISLTDDLRTLSSYMLEKIPSESNEAREIVQYALSSGGKRIRPQLFFLAAKLCGYKGEHYFTLATICEYIHTASLLHDDVIDNGLTRRGRKTVNQKWGAKSAILGGDYIYARSCELMTHTGSLQIIKSFAKAIRKMTDGELFQNQVSFLSDLSWEQYLKVIELKTASLMSACCEVAGLIAEGESTRSKALADFGSFLGMSFQMIDDAIDYDADLQTSGKDPLKDLREGKITAPFILARSRATKEEVSWLNACFEVSSSIEESDIQKVLDLVDRYKGVEQALAFAEKYGNAARDCLKVFPDSPIRQYMNHLVDQLLSRQS